MPPHETPAILYVDDEPLNLKVFEANFKQRFRVVTCTSGPQALEMIPRIGDVGLLIADQRMPEMTGVQLLEKSRELLPDTQRMLLTAFSDLQAVMDAVNRGQVNRYFVKPWIREELLAALEDMMRIFSLQQQVREVETRLLKSERLAAIGQVSAGIAHELMNPVSYMTQNVATLRGELGILQQYFSAAVEARPDGRVKQCLLDLPHVLDDIETGAKHLREVALGVRAQARGDDHETTADLADVAGFVVKLSRAEVRQRARLAVDTHSVRVQGGPVKLCQVFLNLIVNAAQSMEGMGRPGLIEVRWKDDPERGLVHAFVADNGCGIAPELLERAFEPMFTTKSPGVGTGLGLPISRDLVRGMGGELTLASEVGRGTTAKITLKRAEPVMPVARS